jgi:hypothetical protein
MTDLRIAGLQEHQVTESGAERREPVVNEAARKYAVALTPLSALVSAGRDRASLGLLGGWGVDQFEDSGGEGGAFHQAEVQGVI